MCGIIGMAVKAKFGPLKAQEDAFYDMLFVDQLRGDDSTGVIFVDNDGGFGIYKDAYPAYWMVNEIRQSAMGKEMFRKGKAFIGHNRKATVGSIKADTAHPFVVDDSFAVVHNGTLRNHKELADTSVDSEALAITLAPVLDTEEFNKEAFEEAIGKVNGAYAIVAYSQKANKVYIFRNAERPMSLITTNEGWFWGSEFGAVSWCLARNNVNLKDAQSEVVPPHTLYTIDLNENTLTKEDFTPKKATPPSQAGTAKGAKISHIPGTTDTKKTVAYGDGDVVSKNQFKRLRRRWVNQYISFYADDFVEKNFPKTLDDGETDVLLMGESEENDIPHTVQGYYNIGNPDAQFLDRLYYGRIYNMTYDSGTGHVTLQVDRISPISHSYSKKDTKNETSPVVH